MVGYLLVSCPDPDQDPLGSNGICIQGTYRHTHPCTYKRTTKLSRAQKRSVMAARLHQERPSSTWPGKKNYTNPDHMCTSQSDSKRPHTRSDIAYSYIITYYTYLLISMPSSINSHSLHLSGRLSSLFLCR